MTLGTGLYIHLHAASSLAEVIGFELLEGIGSGLLFQPPLIAVQAMVSQADTATATATLGFVRNVATTLGVVLGGVVFQNGMDARITMLRSAGLNSTLIDAFSNGHAAASAEVVKGIRDIGQRTAVEDAFAWSMRNMWILFTCISGIALAVSVLIKHKDLSKEHTETRTGIEAMEKAKMQGRQIDQVLEV